MKSLLLLILTALPVLAAEWTMPAEHPRTPVPASQTAAFKQFCLEGEGQEFFARMRTEFDEKVLSAEFPPEPENYGDPDPRKRQGDKVDKWRAAQDICGYVSGVVEAGAILWQVTGEEKYLKKAKEFFLEVSKWSPDGTTGIDYNDEAHFRLWRKLPYCFDLLRDQFTPDEKATVLAALSARGDSSFASVTEDGGVTKVARNTPADDAHSHPIRFMSLTGIAGLALYDDLPAARTWWETAVNFYHSQFPPWGGDDGGWAEGPAYWRAALEHGKFQDTLLSVGHPDAWSDPFWRQTGYCPLYFVQPYQATSFGDLPTRGKIGLEDAMAGFIERAARRFDDGYLLAYANLNAGRDAKLLKNGLYIGKNYPSGMEHLASQFAASLDPKPEPKPLSELPPARHFADVGWVSMHSALGAPDDDIQLSFKSSKYGSYSHSHADQNAFIINAYGQNLAINSGYREYHRSPHHEAWTRQTVSKNALLIGGQGQAAQELTATGKITRFETSPRTLWTTGDATAAYQANKDGPGQKITSVTRDIVMIDGRYFVVRDHVTLTEPAPISWLLHAETKLDWDPAKHTVVIRSGPVELAGKLLAADEKFTGTVSDKFTTPFDLKYAIKGYVEQVHFRADSETAKPEHTVLAVLWPTREPADSAKLDATLTGSDALTVTRPDGKSDRLELSGDTLKID